LETYKESEQKGFCSNRQERRKKKEREDLREDESKKGEVKLPFRGRTPRYCSSEEVVENEGGRAIFEKCGGRGGKKKGEKKSLSQKAFGGDLT